MVARVLVMLAMMQGNAPRDERTAIPVLTPTAIEARMNAILAKPGSPYWDGPVIVVGDITSVAPQRVSTPDGKTYENLLLYMDSESGRFSIALSPKAQAALHRIGIEDLAAHFRGKAIRIEGRIGLTSLNLVGSPSKYFYDVQVDDLDQFLSVRSAGTRDRR